MGERMGPAGGGRQSKDWGINIDAVDDAEASSGPSPPPDDFN